MEAPNQVCQPHYPLSPQHHATQNGHHHCHRHHHHHYYHRHHHRRWWYRYHQVEVAVGQDDVANVETWACRSDARLQSSHHSSQERWAAPHPR